MDQALNSSNSGNDEKLGRMTWGHEVGIIENVGKYCPQIWMPKIHIYIYRTRVFASSMFWAKLSQIRNSQFLIFRTEILIIDYLFENNLLKFCDWSCGNCLISLSVSLSFLSLVRSVSLSPSLSTSLSRHVIVCHNKQRIVLNSISWEIPIFKNCILDILQGNSNLLAHLYILSYFELWYLRNL